MCFLGGQHRRLTLPHHILWSADNGGGVCRHHLADDQPIKEHADCRQVLFDAWGRMGLGKLLDVGCHMHRLDAGKIHKAKAFAPAEEVRNPPGIRSPGVSVSDVGGEEFDEAAGSMLTGCGDLERDRKSCPRPGTDKVISHATIVTNYRKNSNT